MLENEKKKLLNLLARFIAISDYVKVSIANLIKQILFLVTTISHILKYQNEALHVTTSQIFPHKNHLSTKIFTQSDGASGNI